MEYRPPTRTRHEYIADREAMPGCGLAAYVLVLFGMFILGATGVVIASMNMFYSNDALSPTNLSYGGEVNPVMYGPMRSAAILGEKEVPKVYHAENFLGTSACAATDDALLRIGPEGAVRVLLADIAEVRLDGSDVVVRYGGSKPGELTCGFEADDGGERFARILEAKPTELPLLPPAATP